LLNVAVGMLGYFIYYIVGNIGNRGPTWLRSKTCLNILASLMLLCMLFYVWRIVHS